jgi:hypothetical protein
MKSMRASIATGRNTVYGGGTDTTWKAKEQRQHGYIESKDFKQIGDGGKGET